MKEIMKICVVLLIVVPIAISATILSHPWINQQYVDEYLKEEYPHINIRATLTEWHPYGHHFIVEISILNRWTKVGSGFVDIYGKITDLKIDFD